VPIEPVRERDPIAVDAMGRPLNLPVPWKEFFRSIFYALFGWRRSFTATANINFPNIAAGGQQTSTVTVTGARQGDAVVVSAKNQVNGLAVFGYVSASDTVTVVRFNYSAGPIDPAADDFRVVVLQQ